MTLEIALYIIIGFLFVLWVIELFGSLHLLHRIKVLRMGVRLSSKTLELIEQSGVDVNYYINNAVNFLKLEKDNGKRD